MLGLKNFSGVLKEQVVDYAGRIVLSLQVSFEAGNSTSKRSWPALGKIFSAGGDDKLANIFQAMLHLVQLFFLSGVFVFSLSNQILHLSKQEQTSTRRAGFVQRLLDDALFSTFIHHC